MPTTEQRTRAAIANPRILSDVDLQAAYRTSHRRVRQLVADVRAFVDLATSERHDALKAEMVRREFLPPESIEASDLEWAPGEVPQRFNKWGVEWRMVSTSKDRDGDVFRWTYTGLDSELWGHELHVFND